MAPGGDPHIAALFVPAVTHVKIHRKNTEILCKIHIVKMVNFWYNYSVRTERIQKGKRKMFRVSYIDNATNEVAHKGGFESTKAARLWVEGQGNKILALHLLVWDEDLGCYSILRGF